jgi:hypothetical protein
MSVDYNHHLLTLAQSIHLLDFPRGRVFCQLFQQNGMPLIHDRVRAVPLIRNIDGMIDIG